MKHVLVKRKKTVYLCIEIEGNGKTKRIPLARVHGWKAKLAYKFLKFEANGWSDDVVKAFVGLNALRLAKDEWEARKYIRIVKEMRGLDLHFWADKFFRDKEIADKAWRVFYEG